MMKMRLVIRICTVFLGLMIFAASAQAQFGNYPTYQGPTHMTLDKANVTGACACGTTISGEAASNALVFAPVLGQYVADIIYDQFGEIEEIIYEDLVSVVEMEKVGNDYYVRFYEVRRTDVNSFIAGRNSPGNIYQVMTADQYVDDNGGGNTAGSYPPGADVRTVQAMELPDEDDYHYMFFEGPGGNYVDQFTFLESIL